MSRSEGQYVLGMVTIRFETFLELHLVFKKDGASGPGPGPGSGSGPGLGPPSGLGPPATTATAPGPGCTTVTAPGPGLAPGRRDAPNPPRPFCKIASASSALLPLLEPMSRYKLSWNKIE